MSDAAARTERTEKERKIMTTRTKPVLLLTVLMLLAVLVVLGDSWAHPPGQSEIDRNLALAPVPLDLEGKDLAGLSPDA